ncbi:TM2 domain-containing protein [Bartonella tamiae]|uniref:TM2 domain-containing protein n=1 Tax=Bartonella tamiae Th239 TaxID=1094558 RepID=J0ZQ27_9HYPH|nr:TM2 domain-containing protein [Bartonella tamiae]EJF90718.1 hypothetical protein ME5_01119 [Bartonella tamiae Th239]EJF93905.1 hypothetical protein MEG_00763 [Bartonella tamiae Th307]
MRGIIISYNGDNGIISGQDGNRYIFNQSDWIGKQRPTEGMNIDFVGNDGKAGSILPLETSKKRSKLILAIVCWFFGLFGVHRFMVGKIGTGILMLVLTCTVIGMIITGIWVLIDFIVILMGNFTDKQGNRIDGESL